MNHQASMTVGIKRVVGYANAPTLDDYVDFDGWLARVSQVLPIMEIDRERGRIKFVHQEDHNG